MKQVKCDRCGADIPYVSPYINACTSEVVKPAMIITMWDSMFAKPREVDLCKHCNAAVYDFIFNTLTET